MTLIIEQLEDARLKDFIEVGLTSRSGPRGEECAFQLSYKILQGDPYFADMPSHRFAFCFSRVCEELWHLEEWFIHANDDPGQVHQV